MKKLLLFCSKTLDNEGVLFSELGREYIGFVTDEDLTLQIEGENGQSLVFTGTPGENGELRPFSHNSQYRNHFYRMRQLEPMIAIETEIWRPVPDKPGLVEVVGKRTLGEVYEDIKQALKEQDLWDELDYFHIADSRKTDINEPFPSYRWMGIYPVRGDSEGYYFHIEAIGSAGSKFLYLGKTLSEDIEVALKINNALLRLFN